MKASAKLWNVSLSSATDPLISATASWSRAVAPRTSSDIHSARMPRALDSRAESIEVEASWLCRLNSEPEKAVFLVVMSGGVVVMTVGFSHGG